MFEKASLLINIEFPWNMRFNGNMIMLVGVMRSFL